MKETMKTVRTRQGIKVAGKARPKMRRRKRTLEQRLIPFLVAILIGVTALAGGVALARRAGSAASLPSAVTVTVRPGDTLWSLAKTFGDPDLSTIDRVDALAAANSLAGDTALSPGQRLLIPVADADALTRLQQSDRVIAVAQAENN